MGLRVGRGDVDVGWGAVAIVVVAPILGPGLVTGWRLADGEGRPVDGGPVADGLPPPVGPTFDPTVRVSAGDVPPSP